PRITTSAPENTRQANRNARNHGPIALTANVCTDGTMPLRTMKVPITTSRNARMTRLKFHVVKRPRRSCTCDEWRYAVVASHGMRATFSTGSQPQSPPHPSTWYAHHMPSKSPAVCRLHASRAKRRVCAIQPAPARPANSDAQANANGTANAANPASTTGGWMSMPPSRSTGFRETDKPGTNAPPASPDVKYSQSSYNIRVGGD